MRFVSERTKNPDAEAVRPYVVVLTGGIASGKSLVSRLFSKLGVPIVDTDVIARKLVAPSSPALRKIIEEFGADFVLEDGNLNRRKMRQEIFLNPESKQKLESILHPLIRSEAIKEIQRIDFPYCILVIPLFAESRNFWEIDYVVVVDVDENTQIERVLKRDGIERDLAQSVIQSQSTRQERLAIADEVIDNSGSLESLESRVKSIHQKLMHIAEERESQ